mgnify:CR=1 FL=1
MISNPFDVALKIQSSEFLRAEVCLSFPDLSSARSIGYFFAILLIFTPLNPEDSPSKPSSVPAVLDLYGLTLLLLGSLKVPDPLPNI